MPATTQTVAPTAASKSKKFELPALEFKFGSLTEGTDIPPPLPSPIQEVPTPPRTPATGADKENKKANPTDANGNGVEGSSKPQKDNINAQANGNGVSNGGVRPGSRASVLDEKKAKRSSGWFRRLRTGAPDTASKRSSALYQEVTKPAGPPPPMIPEFSALSTKLDLGDSNDLGGDDLFKNIK